MSISANYNAEEDEYLTKRNGKAFHEATIIENTVRPICEQPGRQENVLRYPFFFSNFQFQRMNIEVTDGVPPPLSLSLLLEIATVPKYTKKTIDRSKRMSHSWRRKYWPFSKIHRYSTIISPANRWPSYTRAHRIMTIYEGIHAATPAPKRICSNA